MTLLNITKVRRSKIRPNLFHVDLNLVFRSKKLLYIFVASLITRLVFWYVLPPEATNFAPDEDVYGDLSGYVAQELPVQEFPGYGPGLYNNSKSFIIPASSLVRLGLNEIQSVRLVSNIYGIGSSLVFMMLVSVFFRLLNTEVKFGNRLITAIPLTFFSFCFWPSNFLWSVLGLRESASQFWCLLSLYFAIRLLDSNDAFVGLKWVGVSASLVLCFGARKETAFVLSLAIFVLSLFAIILRRNYSLMISITIGCLGGILFTTTPKFEAPTLRENSQITNSLRQTNAPTQNADSQTNAPTQNADSQQCPLNKDQIVDANGALVCAPKEKIRVSRDIKGNALTPLSMLLSVSQVQEKRSTNANSAIAPTNCTIQNRLNFGTFTCILQSLPSRFIKFLFYPLPPFNPKFDSSTYAGYENLFWIIIVALAFRAILKSPKTNLSRLFDSSIAVYILTFSAAAALFAGNIGTAFRHKSSILWALLLMIVINSRSSLKLNGKRFFFGSQSQESRHTN